MELKDCTVFVTGGASGLGAGTARRLAAAGARVGILDLNDSLGAALASELGGAFAHCDVASAESATTALATLEATLGRPHVLVNCAGIGTAARIAGKDGPMPLDAFERVIRVNLIGTFNMMRLAAARMQDNAPNQEGERGVIISTASIAAFDGQIGQAAYAASKGGIVALTLPAARELARSGIRVLAIAPGLFKTPLIEELSDEIQAGLAQSIPFPSRLGRPDDFARMVQALIENPYANGETVRLDGALRMPPK